MHSHFSFRIFTMALLILAASVLLVVAQFSRTGGYRAFLAPSGELTLGRGFDGAPNRTPMTLARGGDVTAAASIAAAWPARAGTAAQAPAGSLATREQSQARATPGPASYAIGGGLMVLSLMGLPVFRGQRLRLAPL